MLNAIIKLALRHRPLVVVLCLVALGYGGYLAARLPIDVFPDLDRPRVVVMTEAPGLAPEEVETLVTYPLESSLLGATGVEDVRSQSGFGLSVVKVEFGWNVDIRAARQTVQERLATVSGDLPDGVRSQMGPISSIMGQIMIAGLRRQPGPTGGELAAVPGTPYYAERVPAPGGADPIVFIWKPTDRRNPAAWEAVPVAAVAWQPAAADGSRTVRATVGGHSREVVFPSELQRELALRTLADWVVRPRLLKLTGIAQVVTMGGGRKQYQVLVDPVRLAEFGVTLQDVEAALKANNVNHTGGYSVAGGAETPIRVIGRLGPDPVQVVADLRLVTVKPPEKHEPGKPPGRPVLLADVARVAEGAQVKRGDAGVNGDPAVALTVTKQPHVDTRALTDAVKAALRDAEASLPPDVVVESDLYELRDFIDRGVYNVGEALVVGAGLVLVILFLFLLNVRTTFISLTAIPLSLALTVLSYYLLGRSRAVRHHGDGLLLRGLKWAGVHLVRFGVRRQVAIQAVTWLLVGYCAWRVTTIGADFLPAFDEGTAQLSVSLPAGSSLEESAATGRLVDAKLRSMMRSPADPAGLIRSFVRKSGRAELDEHADPPNASDIIIRLNPDSGRTRAEALAEIRRGVLDDVPGIEAEIEQPLAHLISENLTGSTAQIAIKVYGDDLVVLADLADRVRAAIAGVEGVSSLAVESVRQVDEVHIKLRPDALAFYGVDRATVGSFVQVALNGEVVSQVVEGQRRFDLLVRLEEPYRADIANLGDLRLDLPGGREQVRLSDLADITPPTGGDAGANQVKRDNVRRRIVIRCNALGRDLKGVVTDIKAAVGETVAMPEGYFVEYGGQFESQERATRLIAVLAGVSLIGMFFVLYMLFPSARIVAQILVAVPTAFIGGVLALVVSGQTLTVASLVGFISLGGIAARNGILLVTHYLHLMRYEGERFDEKMVLRGSLERLSPVLMTALTAGIALVPLVVVGQEPGREILYPVATVILGGLITSTFCEFLIRPGLFLRFSGNAAMALVHADDAADGLDADLSPSAGAAPAHDTRPPPVAAGDETRPGHGP